MPELLITKHWDIDERLSVIGYIASRWDDNIADAGTADLIDALKTIRFVARLRSDVLELNRDMILGQTERIKP